jgi:hypothetical protein
MPGLLHSEQYSELTKCARTASMPDSLVFVATPGYSCANCASPSWAPRAAQLAQLLGARYLIYARALQLIKRQCIAEDIELQLKL